MSSGGSTADGKLGSLIDVTLKDFDNSGRVVWRNKVGKIFIRVISNTSYVSDDHG